MDRHRMFDLKAHKSSSHAPSLQQQCYWLWWLTESEPGMLQLKQSEQQFAFKDLMTHLILQFALRIAFRGVLHRCGNQEIHR